MYIDEKLVYFWSGIVCKKILLTYVSESFFFGFLLLWIERKWKEGQIDFGYVLILRFSFLTLNKKNERKEKRQKERERESVKKIVNK